MGRRVSSVLRWKASPWILGSIALVVVTIGLYLLTATASTQPSQAAPASAGDISAGPAEAPIVMIEYSDFQCEYCAGYSAMLAPLRAKFQDRVRFVFRFFPLSNHPYAMVAAQAAYAAHLQGQFWEMHDLLFAYQQEWSEADDPLPYFGAYAKYLELDLDRFETDFFAASTADFISWQKAAGEQAGVEHTPWFVVNDLVVIPRSSEDFEELFANDNK